MTNAEYQENLKFCLNHVTEYNNSFPYNCLYRHSDSKWTADCSNTVKSIINSQGAFKTEGIGAYVNPNGMTGDCTEWGLYSQCTKTSFSKINDGRVKVLYMDGHIGSAYGKEFTLNGHVYNTIETTGSHGDFGRDGCIATYTTTSGARLNHKGGYSMGRWAAVGYFPTSWVSADVVTNYTSKHTVVSNFIKGKTKNQIEKAVKPIFNATYYAKKYPAIAKEVGKTKEALLQYFLNDGMGGNTQGASIFDCTYYEQNNADLVKSFAKNYPCYYIHYLQYGKKEGRKAYLYRDVPADYKWYKQIKYLSDKGIMTGNSSGYYKVTRSMTRSDLIFYLWKMMNKPSVTGTLPYTDCKSLSSDRKKSLIWAYNNKILTGYKNKTFKPDKKISKRLVAICLYRLAGKPTVKGSIKGFSDIEDKKGTEGYKAILWCINNGLIKGTPAKKLWNPKNAVSKKGLAVTIYRYLKMK